ncbi:hypothetical protein JTE90_022589, partial [Oedothorax gibbosus]
MNASDLLNVLREEAPKIQKCSIRVLLDLKTRQHPYWKREFRTYQQFWPLLKHSLNAMLLKLGADCIEDDDYNLISQQPCNFAEEKRILKSSLDRIWKTIDSLPRQDSHYHCIVNRESNVFMHNWSVLDSSLDRLINPVIPKKM